MTDDALLAYVKASAALQRLPLDPARAAAVATHLQRTAAMAQLLDDVVMAPHDEPAELYLAAPFPAMLGHSQT